MMNANEARIITCENMDKAIREEMERAAQVERITADCLEKTFAPIGERIAKACAAGKRGVVVHAYISSSNTRYTTDWDYDTRNSKIPKNIHFFPDGSTFVCRGTLREQFLNFCATLPCYFKEYGYTVTGSIENEEANTPCMRANFIIKW